MDTIYNYFEQHVTDFINANLAGTDEFDDCELSDIACIALNKLPARYYRHSIDLSFYTSQEEQSKITQQIEDAVTYARDKVASNPRKN